MADRKDLGLTKADIEAIVRSGESGIKKALGKVKKLPSRAQRKTYADFGDALKGKKDSLAAYAYSQAADIESTAEADAYEEAVERGLVSKTISIIALIGALVVLFFLTPKMTGKIISNLTHFTVRRISIVALILFAVVGAYFYFRKKR